MEARNYIKNLNGYAPPNSGRKDFIRLDFNENTKGCSKKVLDKMKSIDKMYLSTYPDYSGLNEKVAGYCKVKPNNIVVTNGCDAALKLVADCFVDKNDSAVIIEPTFSMYEFFLTIAGAKIKKIKYNKNLSFPTENLLKAVNKKTKIIILCNPNNPTGTSIDQKSIMRILKKAKNSVVLIDEAYGEFSNFTASNMIEKYGNLIITRTFSKAFGLAGLRAGYIISNNKNIEILKKAYGPFEVNSIAKTAIEAALDDVAWMKKSIKDVKENKKVLESEFRKLSIEFYPSKANFLLARFDDAEYIRGRLKENKILVRGMSRYPLIKNCLRITIGTKKQMRKLAKSLEQILKPALIFDMDGVLVDVGRSYRTAIKKTAEFFTGSRVSYGEIQAYKEKTGFNNDWNITEAIIKSRGKLIKRGKIIDKFQNCYLGNDFDGLVKNEKWLLKRKILEKLSKKYELAIVTGRPKKEAEYALIRNNVKSFFSVVMALEDVSKDKPNPEGIIKAMNALSVSRAIYFGDTKNDKLAASNAKIGFEFVNKNINKIVRGYAK
ncbi:MAG: histidinol-phosphate transaminase [Candidatus Woesearchaeota archaeon]|nr:histidinol-phosphate transaminase [Candidatus Woesearchaeota archaeon]